MLRLALRNLFQQKIRLAISIGGVALALLLILALDAVVAGMSGQLTAYIDHTGADVWVAQAGVRNMHMAASALPASVAQDVAEVPGVARATPIRYLTSMIVSGDDRHLAYIIGLPPEATVGKPWRVTDGAAIPQLGEAIIDRAVARQSGIGLGDTVRILGDDFTVAGLSEGTLNLVSSVAFISGADFSRLRGDRGLAISFVLAEVAAGESPDAIAARIEATVSNVTAQSRVAFAAQERKVINDMSADVLAIMNLIGLLIGLAVLALTVYTATLARRREYGVLKALGVRHRQLYSIVVAQALGSVALGLAGALLLTLLLAALVPRLELALALRVSGASLLKTGLIALGIATIAAILPIRQIASLDPALVFRKGGA
jgi:putative ABC transport system permease protein